VYTSSTFIITAEKEGRTTKSLYPDFDLDLDDWRKKRRDDDDADL